jgi:hypothetical protein
MDEAMLFGIGGRWREREKECEIKSNHAPIGHHAGQIILDSSAPADIGHDKRLDIRHPFLG